MDTEAITRAIEASEFTGVVLIRRGDDTLFQAATGVAKRADGTPITLETRFDTASITKLFTAAAVLQQVEVGALDLDASIHEYVELDDTTIGRKVQLVHLLTHTSGVADAVDEAAGEDYSELWADRPASSIVDTADLLPLFADKEPLFAPGSDVEYSDAGYVLLGMAVESVTGISYREYVEQQVFRIAGMTDSGFFDRRTDVPGLADGGDVDEDGEWHSNVDAYPPLGSPDAGAQSTAADLVTFLRAARGAKLLTQETTEEFTSPQVDVDEEVSFGFGFEFDFDEDGAVRSMYLDGVNAGASGIVRHYFAADTDVVVLSNSEDGAWDVIREIDAQF
ncbi:serine hydrolase domain-containing protein [Plantibacter sp. Mn2098]|uniref:serine hydrolase domain-containing protein n=1 Tax=Plantibacter sp. Mn2098 TaxID=3395266 RepID=UPI003BE48929